MTDFLKSKKLKSLLLMLFIWFNSWLCMPEIIYFFGDFSNADSFSDKIGLLVNFVLLLFLASFTSFFLVGILMFAHLILALFIPIRDEVIFTPGLTRLESVIFLSLALIFSIYNHITDEALLHYLIRQILN
jgi:hypothetical protein